MTVYSLMMDIIALVLVVLCTAYYARKGFIAGMFSFFGTLIALVAAGAASYYLSAGVFDSFFRPGLEGAVAENIARQGFTSLSDFLSNLLAFLPQNLIDTALAALDPSIDLTAGGLARQIVSEVLAPVITPFIMVILFFILFSLVRVLMGAVRILTAGIARMPAVNTVNGALGIIVGVLIGLLYVYLGLCVIWAYDFINPLNPVGPVYFSRSLLYRLAAPLNFFTWT